MAMKGRAVDARLKRIEKELQTAIISRNAAISREDAGDRTAMPNVMAGHDKVSRLVEEAGRLHPQGNVGFAAKARIVGFHHTLATVGQAVLRSLVEDLHAREHHPRR